jgi:hypothetical protein
LITGIATGFSVAIGNIIANDYVKKQSKTAIKHIKERGEQLLNNKVNK